MFAARNPLTLAAIVSLWLASVGNWPLWRAMAELPDLESTRGLLFIASFGLMIACISLALLALGAWRAASSRWPRYCWSWLRLARTSWVPTASSSTRR